MTVSEKEKMRYWVRNWKKTGKILQKLRIKEYYESDPSETILSLSDASRAALKANPPKPTSGLIEMQRYLLRMKNR